MNGEIQISALPAASSLAGSEEVPVIQSGVTKRTSCYQISLLNPGIAGPAGPAGPTGPAGPAGMNGPAGPYQLSSVLDETATYAMADADDVVVCSQFIASILLFLPPMAGITVKPRCIKVTAQSFPVNVIIGTTDGSVIENLPTISLLNAGGSVVLVPDVALNAWEIVSSYQYP